MAGIGNYLRSEILFTAGVHPAARPSDLDRAARLRLARATLRVSRRAYDLKGVTVTAAMARSMKASGQRYEDYRHWVFARPGRPCRKCGTSVEKQVVAGRSLFLCPDCQPAG